MQFNLTVDVASARITACAKIDADAETARLKFVTPGAAQAAVYLQKQNEADNFLTKYPDATSAQAATATDWPMLNAEVGITAASLFAVAQSIQTTASQWTSTAAQIENLRLGGKQTVNNATTISAINAATNITWPTPS